MKWYFKNLAIAADQFVAALFGMPCDWTLSAYAWYYEQKTGAFKWKMIRMTIDLLFSFQKEHCKESFLYEVTKGDKPDM